MMGSDDALIWGIILAIYGSCSFAFVVAYIWQHLQKKESCKLKKITYWWTAGLVLLLCLYQAGFHPAVVPVIIVVVLLPIQLVALANKNRKEAGLAPFSLSIASKSLSKEKRTMALLMAIWVGFVLLRSNEQLEVFGFDLYRWDQDFFFLNAAMGILVIFCAFNFKKLKNRFFD